MQKKDINIIYLLLDTTPKVEFFQKNLKTKLEKLNKIQLLVKKPLRK